MPPLLALLSWPLIVLALARNLTPALAFILALLGGFLLLPERTEFDLPLLPALDKHSVPVLAVLLLLALFRADKNSAREIPLFPENWFVRFAIVGLVAGALLTVVTNGDPLRYGPTILPGMRLYDGLSQILSMIILLLPLVLARKFLARPETHVLFLRVLCIAALGYSLLALLEIRISPQLHSWVYGFFPHSFAQTFRGGGWRPAVFLSHGLVLAIFFCFTILATAGMARIDTKRRGAFLAALVWLFVTLVLSKSFGALIIAALLLPMALFLKVRGQLIVACVIAGLVLSYPITRASGLIPVDKILQQAEQIDPARAVSFAVRVTNEDRMLAKARERPLFGWGGWSRSRVFDPATGIDITTADGAWIIALGVGGWVRYLLQFGLLCAPLFLLLLHHRRYEIGMESSILALILAGNLADLIPNSSMTPLTWVFAGALWGRLELGRIKAGAETGAAGETAPKRAIPVYSRFPGPHEKTDTRTPPLNKNKIQQARREQPRDREVRYGRE